MDNTLRGVAGEYRQVAPITRNMPATTWDVSCHGVRLMLVSESFFDIGRAVQIRTRANKPVCAETYVPHRRIRSRASAIVYHKSLRKSICVFGSDAPSNNFNAPSVGANIWDYMDNLFGAGIARKE